MSVIAGLGGLLGVLFAIPLRRTLIVEQQLAFPEGTATAEVLKCGDERSAARKYLAWAAVARRRRQARGDGAQALEPARRRLQPTSARADRVRRHESLSGAARRRLHRGAQHRCARFRRRRNLVVRRDSDLLGVVARAVIPLCSPQFTSGASAADLAGAIWSTKIRFLGVGAMLVGGVWALFALRGSLWSGIARGLRGGTQRSTDVAYDHTDHDAPMRLVLAGIVLVRDPDLRGVLRDRRHARRRDRADGGHGGRGVPVLGGRRLHGGARRLVEQPDLGHHDRDDPADLAPVVVVDRQPRGRGVGGGDHGRRGGLLRGRDLRRYVPGLARGLPARRDAVAPAARAGARRRVRGSGDRADLEPPCSRRTESALRTPITRARWRLRRRP